MKDITYFGFWGKTSKVWPEVRVTRRDGRLSQEETGVIYTSARAAKAGVAAKNLAIQNGA